MNQAMIDAEKIKEDAEKEASTIKNKAQEEADKLIENAKSKAYYDEYRSQANNFLKTEFLSKNLLLACLYLHVTSSILFNPIISPPVSSFYNKKVCVSIIKYDII